MSQRKNDPIQSSNNINSKKGSTFPEKPQLQKSQISSSLILHLISDFLSKKNCLKTLELFEKEYANISQNNQTTSKILHYFDSGQTREFFQTYNNFQKNISIKTPTLELDKTEFYFYIYFSIYEVHSFLGNGKETSKEAFAKLKTYLEEKGSELAKFPDLIPFFAFPYVKNLREHPSFKHLFAQNWPIKIRETLVLQLNNSCSGNTELELALTVIQNGSQEPDPNQSSEIKKLKSEIEQKNNELELANNKYEKLEFESKETMKEIHLKWSTFVRFFKQRNN